MVENKDFSATSIPPSPSRKTFVDLPPEQLQREAIRRGEGIETIDGVLAVETFPTGRSPEGNGVVQNAAAEDLGINFGKINGAVSEQDFKDLYQRAEKTLQSQDEFIFNGYVRSGIDSVIPVRFRSSTAWTTQFMSNLLVRQEQVDTYGFTVESERSFEIIHAPDLPANIQVGEKMQQTAVITEFNEDGHHRVVVANTEYGGENKKKVFGGMNALLPKDGILPVHGSANADPETGDVTVYEGLSGTGKTTLSNDPQRILIGDDEHGVSFRNDRAQGIFNFEGGSYAKTIDLSPVKEPDIYAATRRRGTVLENVTVDENGKPIYSPRTEDEKLEVNMRAGYPIDFISYADARGVGALPNRLVLLNAESGVLPPIQKLTKEQALHELLKGFTMKMPGTEKGVIEPTATYSAYFGHVFLTLEEQAYGNLYEEWFDQEDVEVYAVGTGYIGGNTERRRDIVPTRKVIEAINSGAASQIAWRENHLGRLVPAEPLPGVPDEFLDPTVGWEPEAYDIAAQKLVASDTTHMEKYKGKFSDAIIAAGYTLRNRD